jgi:methylmalonyl-CoA mutase N-terminal domain/subunit
MEETMETGKTEKEFKTASGIPLKPIYTPDDVEGSDYDRDLALPGNPPFTRGPYPNMYRDRLWRIRQLSGYGSVEDQHERTKLAMEAGGEGVTLLTDFSTYCMLDMDDPKVLARLPDVGQNGAPINSLRDWETLFDGIPLDKSYTAVLGTPQMSPWNVACWLAIADEQGVPYDKLAGTGQNCFNTAYVAAPHADEVKPSSALRLVGDIIEYSAAHLPHFSPVCYSGYNIRECGITAWEEVAASFANAIAIIDEVLNRGRLGIDDFVKGISTIHLSADRDFFEEIAKLRAARRMWCRLLQEKYGAKAERLNLRMHVHTSGSALAYQEPLNNIARVSYQVLALALGGAQSQNASSYDEAWCAPSEEAALISIRTGQIHQFESGITSVADPLGGSYFVEWLTNEVERRTWDFLKRIEEQGGYIPALESGWLHREFLKSMVENERKFQTGEKKMVGVNFLRKDDGKEDITSFASFKGNPKAGEIALASLYKLRKERDNGRVKAGLDELRDVCRSKENIIPALKKAAETYCTIGEVGKVFREVFPVWNSPYLL